MVKPIKSNPIRFRADWERQRKAARDDSGKFHGDITKREIYWFCPDLNAWIKRVDEINAGFADCLEARASDYVAKLLKHRCEALLANPPQSWDGVYVAKRKVALTSVIYISTSDLRL